MTNQMKTIGECDPVTDAAIKLFYATFLCENTVPRDQLYIAAAPGRVNLIGEHTDYNDGFVLPLALEKNTVIVGVKARAGPSRIVSREDTAKDRIVEFHANENLTPGKPCWANYIKGVAFHYFKRFNIKDNLNIWAVMASDVPIGGGLSSSASIEVAYATFLEAVFDLQVDPKERALLCQKSDHTFCNVPCGIMDQFISSCGKANNALLIDCRSIDAIPVLFDDPNVVIVVSNSNVKHELNGGEYAERVAQCKQAVQALKSISPAITHLRDATLDQLEKAKRLVSDVVYKRARHVISENERTMKAVNFIKKRQYDRVGQLMYESHSSLQKDYEVSTPELDALVSTTRSCPGVYGARMTGGGFGGCIVALLRREAVDQLIHILDQEQPSVMGKQHRYPKPTSFATTIGKGARILQYAA